jgi:hypothetical protein
MLQGEYEYMNQQLNQTSVRNDSSATRGIRGRLFIGFGLITIILALAIVLIIYKVTMTENFSKQVIEVELPTHNAFYDLTLQVYESQRAVANWIITKNSNVQERFTVSWNVVDKKIDAIDLKILLVKLKKAQTNIMTSQADSLASFTTEVIPMFNSVLDIIDGSINEYGVRAGGLFDNQNNVLRNGAANIISSLDIIRYIVYALFILVVLASFIVAVLQI